MLKKTHKLEENPIVQATQSGKLFVEDSEFFKRPKIKDTIAKLLESSIYKQIKARQSTK